jgi:iron complex outermembrane recepter protein
MLFRPTSVSAAAAAMATLAAFVLPTAHAQTVAAPDAAASAAEARREIAEPERVVVTGTRRAQAASRVPSNISAIGQEALREKNIGDIKELIANLPGVSAPGNSARFSDSVTVRGLNVSPVNANDVEQFVRSTIAYYLDDTPLPDIGYRIKDISRVETLLGPQGTLYGAGSLGGTIRYITNAPLLGVTEGKLNLSLYQTHGGGLSNDVDAAVNLPIGQTLALRAVLARLDEKGYTDRVSTPPWRSLPWTTQPDAARNVYEDDDWQRVDSGRFALLWKPSPGVGLQFSHTRQDKLANGTSGVSLQPLSVANARNDAEREAAWRDPGLRLSQLPCQPSCAYSRDFDTPVAVNGHSVLARWPEFSDRRFRMNAFDIDIDLGFADLHSSTSHFKETRLGQGDYASQGWTFYYSFGDLGGAIDSDRSAFIRFDNSYKGLSHETRLTSKGDGPLSWLAGLYHTKQDKSQKFDEVLPGMDTFLGGAKATTSPQPDVGYAEDLTNIYKETALFGELSYRITAPWSLTLGARVFNYDSTAKVSIVD